MKKQSILIGILLILVLGVVLAWRFWPAAESGPEDLAPVVKSRAVPAGNVIQNTQKSVAVEPPKLPPTAPHDAPTSPSSSPAGTFPNRADLAAARNNGLAAQTADQTQAIQNKMRDIEQFRAQSQDLLDRKTAEIYATITDPAAQAAELAKLEKARQSYDAFLQQQQAALEAMRASAAAGPAQP